MKSVWFVVALGVGMLFSGCILSLHPIYQETDLIFDPDMVGAWRTDSGATWIFSAVDNQRYDLEVREDDKPSSYFKAYLVQIDDLRLFNLRPHEPRDDEAGIHELHRWPMNCFFQVVDRSDQELQIRWPSYQWLEKLLTNTPSALRHEVVDNTLIVTASPAEQQQFWISHLATKDAFRPIDRLPAVSKGALVDADAPLHDDRP